MTERERQGSVELAGSGESDEARAERAENARRFGCGLLTLFIFPPAFVAWVIWDAVTSLQKAVEEAAEAEEVQDGVEDR